jgi:urate oxidase
MIVTANRYGKARVRIMRVGRGGTEHSVSELSVTCLLQGDFEASYSKADNRQVIATDSIKNIINITAHEHPLSCAEDYCATLAQRLLARYAQISRVTVETQETQWQRLRVGGAAHPHGFLLDGNGTPTVCLAQDRDGATLHSGMAGYTFMKSTQAGWTNYVMDEFTTLAETQDRIVATSMNASWLWHTTPADFPATNAAILTSMLTEFATTYSHGVQDSLYRMGQAALDAAPDIAEIAIACPNKHYLPIDLSRFGVSGSGVVFTPTDEPHGQIECTLRRGE